MVFVFQQTYGNLFSNAQFLFTRLYYKTCGLLLLRYVDCYLKNITDDFLRVSHVKSSRFFVFLFS